MSEHVRRLAFLIAFATAVQAITVVRNSMPAQDSIGFIQFARQLEYHSLVSTLRSNSQHPLYSVLVWMQHSLFANAIGGGGVSWVRAAQWVAAGSAVLLVIPMYGAAIRLVRPFLATSAVLLFSILPITARLGADAVADSTYLLFNLTAIWAGFEYFATRRSVWLLLTGGSAGLGFLVRPEALLLPAALAITLLLAQFRHRGRLPNLRLVRAFGFTLVGIVCVAAPYMLAVGKLTPKRSLRFLPGGDAIFAHFDSTLGRPAYRSFMDGTPVPEPTAVTKLPQRDNESLDFALNHRPDEKRRLGVAAAIYELVRELLQGLHYFPVLFVAIGFIAFDRRPANILCLVIVAVSLAVLIQFAARSGYIASRHVLTLVCLGCIIAARGAWVAAGLVMHSQRRRFNAGSLRRDWSHWRLVTARQRRLAVGFIVAAIAICVPRAMRQLHQSREPHVAAARWLSDHADRGSIVLDSRGWASLFADLPAYDYNGAKLAFEDPQLAYVVVESGEVSDERSRGATLRFLLGLAGQKVAEFSMAGSTAESVQVYAWHPDRLSDAEAPVRDGLRAN